MEEKESLLDLLTDKDIWIRFLEHKRRQLESSAEADEIERFIATQGYLDVLRDMENGTFPLPHRKMISKMGTRKKRIIYVYPRAHMLVLKLLTYLLLRRYDHLFSDCLYSFRPSSGAKDAIRKLTRSADISFRYSYKVDISDYFNSVDIDILLPEVRDILKDDPKLYRFLAGILLEDNVLVGNEVISEKKGIMAGTPTASFFANVYLMGLDEHFERHADAYARYSDDIIIFAKNEDELRDHIAYIYGFLDMRHLSVNHDKEEYSKPGGKWTFLGFSYEDGTIDISPVSVDKIKGKMRRKARSLIRWGARKDIDGTKCAKAFIRIFNRKLLMESQDNDLTWSYWYFPVINTDRSLHEIDRYAQETIRYIVSGCRNKKRYKVSYDDIKSLGYRSLVNEYYKFGS